MYQDILDLVRLLDLDADAHGVDGWFDEDALVFVTRNGEGCQQDFRARPSLDLWYIVTFGGLRCEVGQAEGGGQTATDSLEVWSEGLRLEWKEVSWGALASGYAKIHTILRIK